MLACVSMLVSVCFSFRHDAYPQEAYVFPLYFRRWIVLKM